MVLSRALLCALLAATGCGESLFDAHGKRDGGPDPGDGGPDGPVVPRTCPDECLADAARDFADIDGESWRYVEDTRDRYWTAMLVTPSMATGKPGNGIKRCAAERSAPGCEEMPDALLISSAGSAIVFDPALEFTYKSATPRAIRIAFRAQASADHTIHLYRNSREDHLFRGPAGAGPPVEHSVLVDALPDDRFLIAFEPMRLTGGTVALDFFVYDSDQDPPFPSTCQFAASFEAANGNSVADLCSSRNLTSKDGAGASIPPTIDPDGPFMQQGNFVRIPGGNYLQAPGTLPLARPSALTLQFWVRLNPMQTGEGFVFSDLDELGGGRAFSLYTVGQDTRFQLQAHTEVTPTAKLGILNGLFTAGSTSDVWGFVRIVETPGKIKACINGAPAQQTSPTTDLDLASDRPQASLPFHLGKNAELQSTATFDGAIDDVRVFSEALPCDSP